MPLVVLLPFPDELPMAREVFVASTRAEAIRLARPSLEAKYKAYKDWGQDKVMPTGDAFSADFEELMNDLLSSRAAGLSQLVFGLILIGVILWRPRGFITLFDSLRARWSRMVTS